jgi:methylamine---glutamate N-methyltransferase subunit A
MCGIVGLFAKAPEVEERLGSLLGAMLGQMADRGPDSAGLAVYRDPAPPGATKLSLFSADPEEDWEALGRELGASDVAVRASHAVLVVDADGEALVRDRRPDLRVMSAGERIEIYKEMGNPRAFVERFGLDDLRGSHGLGHTRMATESRVTTQASHPFSTGLDLCLVHNGSLSNHNNLRRQLIHDGMTFETQNDTEVGAAYITWRMNQGMNLGEALTKSLDDLDGFFTFVVGTKNGFGVLRDPIACKPAVMAETDQYVAFGSEYRALVNLPGIEQAKVWEPEPSTVYFWER